MRVPKLDVIESALRQRRGLAIRDLDVSSFKLFTPELKWAQHHPRSLSGVARPERKGSGNARIPRSCCMKP